VASLVAHGFKDATTDEEVIRTWLADRDSNIGIATGPGSGIAVLDIDPRHGGDQSISQLNIPETVEAQTGGGGRHLYFSYPATPVGTRAGIAPGLDICGDGGCIVAPPSRHVSGEIYEWKAGQGPEEVALAPFPEALRELIEKASRRKPDSANAGEPILEGHRNNTLTSLAGTMRRRGMTISEIFAALSVVNRERCVPPLDEEEVRQIAANVARYEPHEGENGPDSAAAQGEGPAAAETKLFRTATEIATTVSAIVPWLAKPWVAAGAITQFVGKIKAAGKSTFVSFMVAAILNGTKFLGELTVRSPVIWLTEQNDVSFREVLRRANLLGRGDLLILSHHLVGSRPWTVIAELAVVKAEEIGAKLIVVDTLTAFAGLSGDAENRAGDAEAAVRAISEPATAHGIAVALILHERKSGGDVGEASRGSSALGGAADLIVSIRRLDDPSRPNARLIRTLGRFDETPLELVIELLPTGYAPVGTASDAKTTSVEDAVLQALPSDSAGAVRVEDLMTTTAIGLTRIRAILRKLQAAGKVLSVGKGQRGDPRRYFRGQAHHTADSAAAGPSLRGAAENLYAMIIILPALVEIDKALIFLRDICMLTEAQARQVIEYYRGELWMILECLDEGERMATFVIALPKE
jgi:hypothetical protein